MNKKVYLSVAAPVYNEEANILQVLEYWAAFLNTINKEYEIVVCNDGSKDNTLNILKDIEKKNPNLVLISYEKNQGYGYALLQALNACRGEKILTLDSDGQFDIKDYYLLEKEMQISDYDIVTGYRYKKRDGFLKVIADRVFNLIVRTFFYLDLRDTNCALKLFKKEIIKSFQFEVRGFPIPTELVIKSTALGYRIGEVGIIHFPRKTGRSKLKLFKTGWETLLFLIYLKIKLYLFKRKIITRL